MANLAFISGKANRKIADQSPAKYFPTVGQADLAAHLVPAEVPLRDSSAFREFLQARRRLLAVAMTELLDQYRPCWLDQAATADADPLAGASIDFTIYESSWDASRLLIAVARDDVKWTGLLALADLDAALDAAASGLDGDIRIGDQDVPVTVDGDDVQIPFGPFMVTGTVEEWRKALERERDEGTLPLSQLPRADSAQWQGDLALFPVTNVE